MWQDEYLFFVASSGTALTLAALVFFLRPDRAQNRYLAFFLFVEALTLAVLVVLLESVPEALATPVLLAGSLGWAVGFFAYALLLSTLATPLVVPLRWRSTRALVFVACLAVFAHAWWSTRAAGETDLRWLQLGTALLAVLALLAAWSAWGRSPRGSQVRQQSLVFLGAFGVRDVAYGLNFGTWFLGYEAMWRLGDLDLRYFFTFFVAQILFHSLLTYGILKHQLFDIDLKLKWTLHRGTVAAVFVAAFFVVSEIVSGLLSDQMGLIAGVLVTGMLVFALAPLQRLADRVADAAMPRVQDTAEYRLVRKREVYRAAVESACQDGVVTEKERDVLATLADSLGLAAGEARAIERDAARALVQEAA